MKAVPTAIPNSTVHNTGVKIKILNSYTLYSYNVDFTILILLIQWMLMEVKGVYLIQHGTCITIINKQRFIPSQITLTLATEGPVQLKISLKKFSL